MSRSSPHSSESPKSSAHRPARAFVIDSATEEAIMTKRAVCCFALLTALSFTSGQAQQNPPVKTKAPDTAASAHAAGSSVWQDIFGITREQFHTLGYDTLSQE